MVKLATALTFGPGYVDWQERIDVARMRTERAKRLKDALRKNNIAACLLSRGDNIRYATGFVGPGFQSQLYYCLFFAEHDAIFYDHAGHYQQMKDQIPWVKPENFRIARSWIGGIPGPEATHEEALLFANEIKQALKDKGLQGEKIGFAGIDSFAVEALNEVGLKTTNVWPLMLETRAVKTKDEINCFKMAAAIIDATFYTVFETLKPGVTDKDVQAAAYKSLQEHGADNAGAGFPVCFSGPNTFERGPEGTDRIILPGDMVYVDLTGTTYMGYNTCCYRTFKAGVKPTAKEKDWYKQVLDRQNAVIDAIKPGATTADAAKHFQPASKWGYPDEVHVLTIEIAHGIGLNLYEMPVINRQWSLKHPQVFEVGNCMAIESREGEWRVGGARIEDMIVVTENGAEIVNRMPRDEILVTHPIF
jgi:Xaa-Pro aminopeptidase